MVDSSYIYDVVINFQTKTGEKASKVLDSVNKQTAKTGKIFTGLNKLFHQSAIRMFSLLFIMRRMRDAVGNLLKPAADMVGIFDIWNMTLGLVFLPIMMALLPLVLQFSEWLIGLPDWAKTAIGVLTLLGLALLSIGTFAIGTAIYLAAIGGGNIVAGIAIVTTAFKGLMSQVIGLATGASLLLMGWTVAIAAIGVVLYGLWTKFGNFGDAIKAWVSGIVLAITFVIQSVAGGILTLIQYVVAGIARIVQAAANAARGAGFGWIADRLQSVADTLGAVASYKLDMMTPISQALDAAGFNPQAVGTSQSPGSTIESQVNSMKSSGMDNASIVNALAGGQSSGTQVVVNQNNTFNVADWQQYQVKMAAQQRQMEQDLKRQLAAGQV